MNVTSQGQLIPVQNEDNASHSREGRYEIPNGEWDTDDLGRCAEFHHQFIHTAETLLTPSYWCLGRALELLRAKLTVRQFGLFLQEHGIHKVRASKARAIARFYATPEELAGISVHDAYQAAIKNRRKQGVSQSKNPKDGNREIDLPEDASAATNEDTHVTTALAALNTWLESLLKDLALNGIGLDETYDQIVSHIDKGIETLREMKVKILE